MFYLRLLLNVHWMFKSQRNTISRCYICGFKFSIQYITVVSHTCLNGYIRNWLFTVLNLKAIQHLDDEPKQKKYLLWRRYNPRLRSLYYLVQNTCIRTDTLLGMWYDEIIAKYRSIYVWRQNLFKAKMKIPSFGIEFMSYLERSIETFPIILPISVCKRKVSVTINR